MRRLFLVGVLVFLCVPERAAGCGPWPQPFFKKPNYIDLDYLPPRRAYSAWGKFKGIADLFLPEVQSPQEEPRDLAARRLSQDKEPALYARYLEAAEAFHKQNYVQALAGFERLRNEGGPDSWVREAAWYMVARCHLCLAQKDWDGNPWGPGPEKKVDQGVLQKAWEGYQAYLRAYPQGFYADSARNLERRILFLAGDQKGLNEALQSLVRKAFAPGGDPSRQVEALHEFRNFFKGPVDLSRDPPLVIAYGLLGGDEEQAVCAPGGEKLPQRVFTLKDVEALEARAADFAPYPGLLRFLKALMLSQLGGAPHLLGQKGAFFSKVPEEAVLGKDLLSLSTQLLRIRVLTQMGQHEAALAAALKMYNVLPSENVEGEIALLQMNRGQGLWLYTPASPLKSERLLRALAQFGLSDAQLETALQDPNIQGERRKFLADELARRYLLSQRFAALSKLLADHPGGFFEPLKREVQALARNSKDPGALVAVAEFLYTRYIRPDKDFLGYARSWEMDEDLLRDWKGRCLPFGEFQGRLKEYIPPLRWFQQAVAQFKKSSKGSETEAQALYYLTRCGRQGEWMTRCTWAEEDPSGALRQESQKAFQHLHKKYPHSSWAQKTPYHY